MSERRFYIMEATEYAEGAPTITESELKHRLGIIHRLIENTRDEYIGGGVPNEFWTIAIGTLLHGDVEKGEEPPAGLFHGPGLPAREINDKPTSSPTRAEWEVWVDRMPIGIEQQKSYKWKLWLLSMPIVPKGE